MRQNNLAKIDSIMNTMEIGLRSYFPFALKADRKLRLINSNLHGVYSTARFYSGAIGYVPDDRRRFRVTTAGTIFEDQIYVYLPPSLDVWKDIDDLFVIIKDRVIVYPVKKLIDYSNGTHTGTEMPITFPGAHDIVIDNPNNRVLNNLDGSVVGFDSAISPYWSNYPLIFLPPKKTVYAVVIGESEQYPPRTMRYDCVDSAAKECGLTTSQIYNNIRTEPRNKVLRGCIDGEMVYLSFIKKGCEKQANRAWYNERIQLLEKRAERKTA